ncbi:uncharacterized protein LOC117341451 [Pecten maximus]|uniref:uncharacterized protein LOC117341451 n=1 Tax=Pecten maximus TaxID=6579 RepID=UPI001458C280|nr:uncharacterized protein LOC117341451 [Pecten maximus]
MKIMLWCSAESETAKKICKNTFVVLRCRSDPSACSPVSKYLKEKTEKKLHRPSSTERVVLWSACRVKMAGLDQLVLSWNNNQHVLTNSQEADPDFCPDLQSVASQALESLKSVELNSNISSTM